MKRRGLRLFASIAGVLAITFLSYHLVPVNATTAGFGYLLFVLVLASTWGFPEAATASLLATLAFNYYFFPPVGALTIADPQNWIALFSFLATALIASRLSDAVKQRALDASSRTQDVERLYTFSRAILLINSSEPFAKELARQLAEVFGFEAVVLYERRSDEFFRAGPADFDGLENQLREAALQGTTFQDPERNRLVTAVRLGSEPIASLAVQGVPMPDSVLQGIANLVAIGLERARAQDLAHQVEAAQQSERLRTTLIDAMAHELKTPLTSIKAATTSLLAHPGESNLELVKIADEEAERLRELIDDSLEMARLDTAHIDLQPERAGLGEAIREVVASMQTAIDGRPVEITIDSAMPEFAFDRRLIKLAIKQLFDNALKYSPPSTPVTLRAKSAGEAASVEIVNGGDAIPAREQSRIFERFYRSPSSIKRIPGSGLGLSIAHRILLAHHGDLTVTSQPGETTFRMTLPMERR